MARLLPIILNLVMFITSMIIFFSILTIDTKISYDDPSNRTKITNSRNSVIAIAVVFSVAFLAQVYILFRG